MTTRDQGDVALQLQLKMAAGLTMLYAVSHTAAGGQLVPASPPRKEDVAG